MTGRPSYMAAHRQLALVAEHWLELRRLANQAQRRRRDMFWQGLQQAADTQAPHLFVV
ncbi:hypothetical protein D3C78_1662750 [compost metagenome]